MFLEIINSRPGMGDNESLMSLTRFVGRRGAAKWVEHTMQPSHELRVQGDRAAMANSSSVIGPMIPFEVARGLPHLGAAHEHTVVFFIRLHCGMIRIFGGPHYEVRVGNSRNPRVYLPRLLYRNLHEVDQLRRRVGWICHAPGPSRSVHPRAPRYHLQLLE